MGIAVHAMSYYPATLIPDPGLKTEVGIEDSLHIEFEYDKPRLVTKYLAEPIIKFYQKLTVKIVFNVSMIEFC